MDFLFEKHKRWIISLCLIFFFWLSSVVSSAYGLELTGFLLLLSAAGSVIYLLIYWLIHKKKQKKTVQVSTKKEMISLIVLLGLLCFSGMLESYPNLPAFTSVYTLLFIYVLIFSAVMILNYYLKKKGVPTLTKSTIRKIAFLSFAIGIGRVLILIDSYGDNDALIIIALIYFPIMFLLAAGWIFKQIKSIITLKNEKSKAELALLKSQINPHFLFNTLNNLYGLTVEKSDDAPEVVLKLSDMLSYTIYEGKENMVPLKNEISYLENYIALHKIRYHNNLDIIFNSQITGSFKIAPLLFIILLENAFKHGVERLTEKSYIHIDLKAENDTVIFNIENNFELNDTPIKARGKGIGLENLKERLKIIYPKTSSLEIEQTDSVYKATLKIDII